MKKILLLPMLITLLVAVSGCSSLSARTTSKNTSKYECNFDSYNCDDFSTHAEAQRVYEACGGIDNDVHNLDRDKDGSACETLP